VNEADSRWTGEQLDDQNPSLFAIFPSNRQASHLQFAILKK